MLTLSPTLMRSSLTTPAVDDGISIDALSLSTVIRLCSALTASPGLTSSSMTPTSLKSPMSGTLTSIVAMSPRSLQHHSAKIAEHLDQVGVEAGRGGAVDDAVVPRQRQRQDQARLEGLAVPHRARGALSHSPESDFPRVVD